MFRLFLKEHLLFIIFQFSLVLFVMLLYWLDGFRNLDTAVYSIVISIILTLTFLGTLFVKKYTFYKKILSIPTQLEVVLQRSAQSPEIKQVENYLQHIYRLYQKEVQLLYARQNRHLQFMNSWVHQMKTPISILELIAQNDEQIDSKSVMEEMDRLKRGLEAVLMNARLDTFEEDMQIERIDLKQLVKEVVTENKRLFIGKHLFPVISMDDDCMITSDRKWIRYVIAQFVTNAVKYTFEKNKKVYFETSIEEKQIIFSVRDEGIGIPASDIKRVTKAFFTGENGRKTGESTGMGLYLAQEICSRLGHEIDVESSIGQGTTVSIKFDRQEIMKRGGQDVHINTGGSNESI
ncbi:sensor histidine kinase [Psychrobacillus lasiicapitis]|uniref:histidine kinase n=1 Tax=Psychrobacillus lasiicapitis TaxID=1636719 RepID=A0A544SVJ7_9BACI|nr:sensor histidine kinase [Psychrobacillus lasiicapitis]TQR09151.1 HAMP domain-containing histidine kinase [Psychrobacillus lasiicapitis]GGA47922.1 sensor histidine kinase [Psychrobacillus lasiicapitis]